MKSFSLSHAFLGMAFFMTSANALAICPNIDGLYVIESTETDTKTSLPNLDPYVSTFETDITLPTGGAQVHIAANSGAQTIYAIRGPYNLDGFERFLSFEKSADNYFVKYTGKCDSQRIAIHQEGSDNNSQSKRVSTYDEETFVLVSEEHVVIRTSRRVRDTAGKLLFQGVRRQQLARVK